MKIKEIIVVEGKDDTVAIKRAVDADTIETNGSAVNQEVLDRIKHAQEIRGVIVFTDPDYPGERIRKIVSHAVPGCKHAFLPKNEAIAKSGKGLGVEHATPAAIRKALDEVKQEIEEFNSEIEFDELVDAGLIGGSKAKERREKLGVLLNIGYTNGKQLYKRLQMFQISKESFGKAIAEVLQGEKHSE
ncbi:ribonuclease M5 [Ferdinandcohnia quinoae]|uniref:Ribonuclease M5 n=1 Tax=Fredinandcohnia quinoae TaxID=2918902 RepID=A0AAW5EAN7_9BACI|nr:ribonuclease M5 [Fredinandcohnia sp. SECRCQ15]MCH1626947.1 ribonuclease M5 [Fredinandcohnia sp. SECRCQ15]